MTTNVHMGTRAELYSPRGVRTTYCAVDEGHVLAVRHEPGLDALAQLVQCRQLQRALLGELYVSHLWARINEETMRSLLRA